MVELLKVMYLLFLIIVMVTFSFILSYFCSGLYPLSKPGRDNMYGASLRGSVTLQRGHIKPSPSQVNLL